MALSNDPNQTSGRASATATSYTFPLTENPTAKTRLKFLKYSRLNPNDLPTFEVAAVITLPLPLQMPDRVSVKSEIVDMGIKGNIDPRALLNSYNENKGTMGNDPAAMAKTLLEQGESMFSNAIKGYTESPGNAFFQGLHALAVAPRIFDSNEELARFAQRTLGVIQNPHTQAFFKGVDLRAHNLQWRMSPRSRQEANALTEIKNLIKQRILPEESLNGYALDYPDLIEVDFIGDVSKHLGKIYRSFCTGFSANPGGVGGLSFFEEGQPTEVEFNMDLIELNILTRNKLREGEQQ